jgi:DNA-binding response OmpR family regulator
MGDRSIRIRAAATENHPRENSPRSASAAVPQGVKVKVLIAHGDAGSRYALREMAEDLSALGLEPIESAEGTATIELLTGDDVPALAVVDWDLPGVSGPELCRRVRAQRRTGSPYIILLAASEEQVGEALAAGADDCVHAAAGQHELQARLFAARRLGGMA